MHCSHPHQRISLVEQLHLEAGQGEMADPIATVETIMRIAVAINKAVHKARKNIDDCKEVQTLVAMGSGGLKVLKEKGVTDRVPELSDALGHLKMTLKHALSIVEACQEDHNLFQRVVMADDLSNQLHHVKEDITQKTTMVTFAISAYMAANADHTGHQLRHHQVSFIIHLHLSCIYN